jgi:hypothetical protein
MTAWKKKKKKKKKKKRQRKGEVQGLLEASLSQADMVWRLELPRVS